jgi:hypothetical protein
MLMMPRVGRQNLSPSLARAGDGVDQQHFAKSERIWPVVHEQPTIDPADHHLWTTHRRHFLRILISTNGMYFDTRGGSGGNTTTVWRQRPGDAYAFRRERTHGAVVKIELVEAWQLILLSCANDKTLCVGQPASVVVCKARLLDASRSTGSDWKQLYVRGPSNVVGSAARDH